LFANHHRRKIANASRIESNHRFSQLPGATTTQQQSNHPRRHHNMTGWLPQPKQMETTEVQYIFGGFLLLWWHHYLFAHRHDIIMERMPKEWSLEK
jgi:hypothetical protein